MTMAATRHILLRALLAMALAGSAGAFIVTGSSRLALGRKAFAGGNLAVSATTQRREHRCRHGCADGSRRTAGSPRMLIGQEFATCSDDDFKAYIIGWAFAWSGIIPYTIIAAKSVLGTVVSAKVIPAVSKGEDATVSNQPILLYKEPVKLLDIVNIVGRFQTFDDLQTEKKQSGKKSDFLLRTTFKESLRRSKFRGWPKGPDGQPALSEAFGGDLKAVSRSIARRQLSESAMDAVFDSFCGSPLSIIADRFKVDDQLESWRKDNTFNVKGFENGLLVGRLLFLFTIVSVIGLEFAGYGVFFIQPLIIRYGNPLAGLGF